MQDIFLGRQPIYTRDLELFGYELLFRSGTENRAVMLDGDQATSQVIVNTFLEIGLEQIVGDHPAFLNLTRSFLLDSQSLPFPRERVVLEVLENVEVDQELLDAVRGLAANGYRIALDDFVYRDSLHDLVTTAEIVKLDVLAMDRAQVQDQVARLRAFPVQLLAEKVETQEDFDFCKAAGFDYFQGYFLSRPNVIQGQRIPANRLSTLRLLARLQDPDVEATELEQIISHDVALSYRLLRYINSAFFALPRKVESIRQALVYLGTRAIRTWVSLIALSGVGDKPHALMATAMVRARMCELLAAELDIRQRETYFTVGLFSTLDALMDVPMEQVIKELPFTEEISGALLRREGQPGAALRCTLAYEHGLWDDTDFADLPPARRTEIYLEAVAWADEATRELGDGKG